MLPEKSLATTTYAYALPEMQGSAALVVAGLMSLSAILILVVFMLVKASRGWKSGSGIMPQTHVAPYLISLLLANAFQALGSVLNVRWIERKGTHYEPICVAQGVMKNIGNVGTALWSLVIAFHTFDLLFLRRRQLRVTLWATVIGTWSFILVIDMIGPVFLEKSTQGPFFGVSGYWCWITSNYPRSRIFLEYIFMFLCAFLCTILHCIVFLRLRGNLSGDNLRSIRFRRIPRSERWVLKIARDEVDSRMYKVMTQLMWYPLTYILVIIPIAAARFVNFTGQNVPFAVIISTDFIFNLNGFLNVLLYGKMYRRISVAQLPTFATPRKSLYLTDFGVTPFVLDATNDAKSIYVKPPEADKSAPNL